MGRMMLAKGSIEDGFSFFMTFIIPRGPRDG